MLRLLRYLLITAAVLAAAAAGAALFLLQDPNRFKPQLEALIADGTGVPVTIGGDLGWRLWPPVSITAAGVTADYEGQRWQVGRLAVELDALAVLRDPADWRVESLTVEDTTMTDQGAVLTVQRARLSDLAPNRAAPLTAELSYAPAGGEPLPVTLDGRLAIDPDTLALALEETRFETPQAVGTCNLEATPAANPKPAPPATEADLIPVDVFRAWSWVGDCLLDWVELDGERFEQVALDLRNDAGDSALLARLPRFFGGEAVADVAIDAREEPVRWTVTPTLTGVNSRELMAWLDQPLDWIATLAYGGTLRFEGNNAAELAASVSGETHFDGGDGRIDIAEVRRQVLALAAMFNETERIERWPEVWDYRRLEGTWRIDGHRHVLDAALDNLKLVAEGDYRPLEDELDMLLTLEFGNDPALPVFDLNPLLYDLPIPVRCRGTLAEPECRVDPDAAQRIVASAMSGENSKLRSTLERKIEEDVPEEYRDAARSLLDLLGSGRRTERQPH
ncbi:MAG TPA: AsmA family protein [Pseudomonadales bacterium]